MNPTAVIVAICVALSGAAGFGSAWTWRGRTIDKLKLGAKDERIAIYRANRVVLERATSQVISAQNKAATRNAAIRADAVRAGDAGSGLRIQSANTVRAYSADSDACGAAVRAYGVILDESSRLLGEVAAVADQCISDNQALTEAWPGP